MRGLKPIVMYCNAPLRDPRFIVTACIFPYPLSAFVLHSPRLPGRLDYRDMSSFLVHKILTVC